MQEALRMLPRFFDTGNSPRMALTRCGPSLSRARRVSSIISLHEDVIVQEAQIIACANKLSWSTTRHREDHQSQLRGVQTRFMEAAVSLLVNVLEALPRALDVILGVI